METDQRVQVEPQAYGWGESGGGRRNKISNDKGMGARAAALAGAEKPGLANAPGSLQWCLGVGDRAAASAR